MTRGDEPAIQVVLLRDGAVEPRKAHDTDTCYDFFACESGVVWPRSVELIPLGVAVLPPEGFSFAAGPRSSQQIAGIVAQGEVDWGYTGEVRAILINATDEPWHYERGNKVLQMKLQRVYSFPVRVVASLPQTARGANGFGSSGR